MVRSIFNPNVQKPRQAKHSKKKLYKICLTEVTTMLHVNRHMKNYI